MISGTFINNQRKSWIICLTGSLFFLFVFFIATVIDSISIFLMKDFSMNASQLANLSAYFFYGNVFILIPAGLILDRKSTKLVLCSSLAIFLMGTLVFFITNSILLAMASRFICGIGSGFAFLCCIRLAIKHFPPEKLPLIIGAMITMAYMGGIISHSPFILLVQHMGWRHAGLVVFFVGVCILIMNLLVLPKDTVGEKKNNEEGGGSDYLKTCISNFKQVTGNGYQWLGGLYTTFLNLPVILFGALWSSIYLQQVHRLSTYDASFVSSLTFFGLIIGTPLIGLYAKNAFKIANTLMVGAIFCCILLFILIYYPLHSTIMLSVIFFFLGFFSSTQSVGYTIVLANTDPKVASLSSSIMSMTVMGGGTLIKILFGYILDWGWNGNIFNNIRIYSVGDYSYALLFVQAFFIISLIIACLYRLKIKNSSENVIPSAA